MKQQNRERRRHEILDAALAVLTEKGYRDASMLAVARRASASKETMYAWFGDKAGLFDALIRRNADGVQAVLDRHMRDGGPIDDALAEFGAALLQLLLGDAAVAINRAAISEAVSDPTLARTLAAGGREAVLPSFMRLLERQFGAGRSGETLERSAEDFLGLLIGDLQLRRLLGVAAEPTGAEIEARARRATRAFLCLYRQSSP